jgi:AAHS family 4-hydroxybenzoate transporter-like MFS transporter
MLIFGGFTLASAYATNLDSLVVLRFLTGIGLGAAMPNATTLFSEYCPNRIRSLLITCMFCGYNLGMATGGFISSWLIPTFGWHSLFLLGGWSPLILMLLVIFFLPESYRFLIVKGKNPEKVRKILSRIAPEKVQQAESFHIPEEQSAVAEKKNVFGMLFSKQYAKGTILLWSTYFMGLVVIYLLTSWLPTLMRETGATMERAAFIGGLFNLVVYSAPYLSAGQWIVLIQIALFQLSILLQVYLQLPLVKVSIIQPYWHCLCFVQVLRSMVLSLQCQL